MIFQTFDDKKECIAIFVKDKIHKNKLSTPLTKTWNYSEVLKNKDVEYAKYYCGGKSLSEACPDHLRKEWEDVNRKLGAFYRATTEAKLELEEHCFFDLVPPHFLLSYGRIKSKICAHVFSNFKKPQNYEFMVNLAKITNRDKEYKTKYRYNPLRYTPLRI